MANIINKRAIAVLAVACIAGFTAVAGAATYTPGSEDDPVVTKSYVDAEIAELKSTIVSGGSAASTYQPLQIAAGKSFIGGAGTELILRSGEATAIDNGANGISDITAGTDLWTGNAVSANHLLLVPRADGRGIKATTDIWLMVRGAYEIQ